MLKLYSLKMPIVRIVYFVYINFGNVSRYGNLNTGILLIIHLANTIKAGELMIGSGSILVLNVNYKIDIETSL